MRYRVRFMSRGLTLIAELASDARSAEDAIALVTGYQWPHGAHTLQIVDLDGNEIYRISKDKFR